MSQENKIIIGVIAITAFLLLVVFFLIVLVAYINKRKTALLAEKKAIKSTYENELLKTQLEVQEQTFREISQEIHDNIGQALSFIKLTINTINVKEPENANNKLFESKELITQVIQDLRDLSKTLNTDFITQIGLSKAIEQQLNLLEKTKLYKTTLLVKGHPENYGQKQELVIYRIIQELLNNTVKHSNATTVNIEIAYAASKLTIHVADNGDGFDITAVAQDKGIGLNSMKKRMELINGHFDIISSKNEGTSAILRLQKQLPGSSS